jgi:hypothetical protein
MLVGMKGRGGDVINELGIESDCIITGLLAARMGGTGCQCLACFVVSTSVYARWRFDGESSRVERENLLESVLDRVLWIKVVL